MELINEIGTCNQHTKPKSSIKVQIQEETSASVLINCPISEFVNDISPEWDITGPLVRLGLR